MIDSGADPIIERIATDARRPVAIDPDAKARLMAAVVAEGAPGSFEADTAEFQLYRPAPRGIMLTAGRLAAMAAGLVGIGILVAELHPGRKDQLGRFAALLGLLLLLLRRLRLLLRLLLLLLLGGLRGLRRRRLLLLLR